MLKQSIFLVCWAILGLQGFSQPLVYKQVKNVGDGYSSYPYGLTRYNNSVYFFASTSQTNANYVGLWKTDGTEASTVLVKDSIGQGYEGGQPQLLVWQDKLYFMGVQVIADSMWAYLYTSNGTEAGTQVVKRSGRPLSIGGSDGAPASCLLVPFGNRLYFNFYDADGGMEPWFTDGTPAGTQMLLNISTDLISGALPSSYPHGFTVFEGSLYFWANPITVSGTPTQLWKTDGTSAGTQLIREFIDINFAYRRSRFVAYNGRLYFSAMQAPGSGYELWSTDGTSAGTTLLKEINPGTENQGDGVAFYFTGQVFKGKLYFWGFEPGTGHELWHTDGTANGTKIVLNTNPLSLASINTQDLNENPFFVFGSKMYYSNKDGQNGREPWVTDGTAAGTMMLANVNPVGTGQNAQGSVFGSNSGFYVFNQQLHFRGNVSGGPEILRIDTTNNAVLRYSFEAPETGYVYCDIPFDLSNRYFDRFSMIELNGKLIFPAGYSPTPASITSFDYELHSLAPPSTQTRPNRTGHLLHIYPQPAHNQLIVSGLEKINNRLTVTDFLGKTVIHLQEPAQHGDQLKLDIHDLRPGIYNLICGFASTRFIVE